VREIVITPGPAAAKDNAPFEFEVSVLPWGPVTGALQEKGMPITFPPGQLPREQFVEAITKKLKS
jgi:hypothetical protein